MLEGYTTLAHAAAVTERIELGTLVTGVTYRHPGILLKTVTTLDVLSGGRAWLGIGAAWNEEEHRGLGVPYPSTRERFALLEDTLRLAHRMFADDDRPFEGDAVSLERPLNHPQPVRRPPIMVGGGGEKRTLRLVAQYADACNLFDTGLGPEGLPHKLDVLRRHCDEVGRPYDEIEKTCLTRLTLDTGAGLPPRRHAAVGRRGRRAARAPRRRRDRPRHRQHGQHDRSGGLPARRRGRPPAQLTPSTVLAGATLHVRAGTSRRRGKLRHRAEVTADGARATSATSSTARLRTSPGRRASAAAAGRASGRRRRRGSTPTRPRGSA